MRATDKQRGFTLLEIMVVIVIIGVLASLVVPNLMGNKEKADKQKAVSDIVALENALDMYKLDNHRYPTTNQGPYWESHLITYCSSVKSMASLLCAFSFWNAFFLPERALTGVRGQKCRDMRTTRVMRIWEFLRFPLPDGHQFIFALPPQGRQLPAPCCSHLGYCRWRGSGSPLPGGWRPS